MTTKHMIHPQYTHPVNLLDQQVFPIDPLIDGTDVPRVPPDQGSLAWFSDILLQDEHLGIPTGQRTVDLIQAGIERLAGEVVIERREDRMGAGRGDLRDPGLSPGDL